MTNVTKDPYQFNSAQYDTSLLQSVGDDVYISVNVEIRRPSLVSVGSHVAIDSGFYMTTRGELGSFIHIGPYVKVIGGIGGMLKMAGFNNIAAGSTLVGVSDGYMGEGIVTTPGIPKEFQDKLTMEPIVFERFVNVGVHSVIMPGVTLREGSVIGACSLVTKDTEPWTVYVGVPARPIKIRPQEKMLAYAKKMGY